MPGWTSDAVLKETECLFSSYVAEISCVLLEPWVDAATVTAAGGVPSGTFVGSMVSSTLRGLVGVAPDMSTATAGWICCTYWFCGGDAAYASIFTSVG
jgi:hypothetical protein